MRRLVFVYSAWKLRFGSWICWKWSLWCWNRTSPRYTVAGTQLCNSSSCFGEYTWVPLTFPPSFLTSLYTGIMWAGKYSNSVSHSTVSSAWYCILACICAEHFQWDQDESGGGRYCEPCFTLCDGRFKNDLSCNQGLRAVQNWAFRREDTVYLQPKTISKAESHEFHDLVAVQTQCYMQLEMDFFLDFANVYLFWRVAFVANVDCHFCTLVTMVMF